MNNRQLQDLLETISQNVFYRPFNHRLKSTGEQCMLKSHSIEINLKQFEVLS